VPALVAPVVAATSIYISGGLIAAVLLIFVVIWVLRRG
jgi:flagellar biogenesis protein FliO